MISYRSLLLSTIVLNDNINKQVVYSNILNHANYQSIINMKTVHKIITSIIHMCFMANDLIYVINYFIFVTV